MKAPSLAELESAVTGRQQSYFAPDVLHHAGAMRAAVEGRNVLVVGGGGSIGSVTTRALLALGPAAVHVVDLSENYLAELIRDARSGGEDLAKVDLRTHVLDYGAAMMNRFLRSSARFDVVFNFAAVKHVRSEKDVYSLLHMLDVNIVRQARLKRWLAELGHDGRYFTVSTDKAANPASLMGASKRAMECVAFDVMPDACDAVTTARFANVAFSNGSLLQAFMLRMEKRQPLAVPTNTRRYFISHAEAADICMLTGLVAPTGHVLIPTLQPQTHLALLDDIVERVLGICGYSAWFTDDERAAKRAMDDVDATGRWPVLLTALDTAGEKPYEEFAGAGERIVPLKFETLSGIVHARGASLEPALAELSRYIDNASASVDKGRLAELLRSMVPTLRHVETGRHLDARM